MTCQKGLVVFAGIATHNIRRMKTGKITIGINPSESGLIKSIGSANDALFLRSNRMSI